MKKEFKLDYWKGTYREFIDYAINTPRASVLYTSSESKSERFKDFSKTDSWEEAIKLSRYGWGAGIKELELDKCLIVSGQSETHNDLVGSHVNVGRFLSGAPDCMIRHVDLVERSKPELTIVVPLNYSGSKDSSLAIRYAKKVLKIIIKLRKDYNLRIVGVFHTRHSNKGRYDTCCHVTIKDFEQDFVINNIAFSFHPSFFRRIYFKFIETKKYNSTGYGVPHDFSMIKVFLREKLMRNDNFWLMPSFQDYNLNWSEEDIYKHKAV